MQHKLQISRGSRRYILCAPSTINTHKAPRFDDEVVARQFLHGFDINTSSLNRFASHIPGYTSWSHSGRQRSPKEFLAHALSKRTVVALPALKGISSVSRILSGKRYRIMMLCDTNVAPAKTPNLKAANEALAQMELSDKDRAGLIQSLGLPEKEGALEQALVNGVISIREEQSIRQTAATETQTTPPRAADKPVSTAQPAAAPQPAPAEPANDDPVDQKAQAEALQRAAETGAPFCEECEKPKPKPAEVQPASITPVEPEPITPAIQPVEATEEPAPEKALSWVEFKLVDNLGDPLSDKAYKVTDVDGKVHEGTTDDAGRVRIEDVAEGEYQLEFPGLENDSEPTDR